MDPLTWEHGWSYEVEGDRLAERGVDLVLPLDPSERDRLVAEADVIISSSLISVDAVLISTFKNCTGILCYSSGRDAVDVAAATSAGIKVANIQAATADVADHAFALLLAAHRNIIPMAAAADRGEWNLTQFPDIWTVPRLEGSVLGVVGAGNVGRAVADRGRGFGMTVVATYHTAPAEPAPNLPHRDLPTLLAEADFVVLCASLNEDSHHMINAQSLSLLKPTAILVNVGRGGLVDENALAAALDNGTLRAVALDVRDPEPPSSDDPLRGRWNAIQTPHIGGASQSSRSDLHTLAADGVLALLEQAGRIDPLDVKS